jgi:hypothetical protein
MFSSYRSKTSIAPRIPILFGRRVRLVDSCQSGSVLRGITTMDFLVVSGVFVIFLVGLVLVFQGIVGKEINPEGTPFRWSIDPQHPGIEHPPERHRVRLVVIGAGLMVLAVGIGIVAI